MAIQQAMCTSFKAEILDEGHDLVADTLKIALYTSSANLGAGTTAYSTSNEISGTGYTAGGVTLTNKAANFVPITLRISLILLGLLGYLNYFFRTKVTSLGMLGLLITLTLPKFDLQKFSIAILEL